ncbi:MAG: YihY/virulence factor BrkB family protein [Solirubrobacteraceae bacterium]|jgi:membrane protein
MAEPRTPSQLPRRSWWPTIKRTVKEFREDNLTDWAAALTYYAVLSLFPALVALVSIVGLFGDPVSTTGALGDIATDLGPASAARAFRTAIQSLTSHRSAAGVLLVVGMATALWTASGYVGAFIRASNTIYEVPEGRPFWRLRPLQILVTMGMVLLLTLVAVALVVSGPVASAVGAAIGASQEALTVWKLAKWPVLLAVVLTMFAILYYVSPNARLPGFRWITPGSVLAVLVWILASAGFAFYVAHFGSYNETYGTLGGVVTFLVWLWIGNLALLLGLELNAELERARELESGHPEAERELQLQPRRTPG